MGHVQLLIGIPYSGKTARSLEAYAETLRVARRTCDVGRAVWLAPAREVRQTVLERLLPMLDGVAFQPHVLTFDRFAERVLLETGQGGRAISSLARRLILRQVIRELSQAGRLRHFARTVETEGFLDVVSRFVSELKRAEIWPDNFLKISRQSFGKEDQRGAELGAIYERYQQLLNDHRWYDAEGRFWLARTAMQTSTAGFWRELSLVVVDGFSDFTRTQLEILEQLAVTSRTMIVTLPGEEPVVRPELFHKPMSARLQLTNSLKTHGKIDTVICRPKLPSRPAGLRQILERLFENPRTAPRSKQSSGCEIIAAVGDDSERAAVALHIKQLLARGISPRDIVVGVRSAAVTGPVWQAALTAAGIPVWCEESAPWSRSPFPKALFNVLQLELEDWPFERLQSVLTSSYFCPPGLSWNGMSDPQRVTGVVRRQKLHSQRVLVLRGLERSAANRPADGSATRSELEFARKTLGLLSDACEPLRQNHDLAGWANALATLTTRLGLVSAMASERDVRDAEWLQRLLRAAAPLEAELTAAPLRRNLAEFVMQLRDVVRTEPPPGVPGAELGCVRILGAETLRHLQPRFVFLAEMTEDSFPSRRSDDCLLTEADRLQLRDGGLTLSHRELQQREEMLLFYQAVTRATEKLTISYSRVNRRGHEVYPSPYVTALAELFEPALEPTREGQLDPVPSAKRVLTKSDLRLAAVSQAREKHAGWWRLLLDNASTAGMARNVLAAAEVADQRFHTHGFTPFEGRLVNPRHLAELNQRFSPERQFSATELEGYAACPFRFWMAQVLRLEPLSAPEEATDHLSRGVLVHDVLAQLSGEQFLEKSDVAQRFRELVETQLQRRVAETELQQALQEIERRLLSRWADGFADQHVAYHAEGADKKLTALRTLPEIPFGAAKDADAAAPQDRYPALTLGSAESTIRLGGRIDRVDVAELDGQPVFTVIDFKTGARPAFSWERVKSGHALQLPLYLLAVLRLGIAGPDAVPLWMGYWSVKETGFAPSGGKRGAAWSPLDKAAWDSLETVLSETILRLVAGIRAGQFVAENADENCTGHCPYHTVCRVNQVRSVAERYKKRIADLPGAVTTGAAP